LSHGEVKDRLRDAQNVERAMDDPRRDKRQEGLIDEVLLAVYEQLYLCSEVVEVVPVSAEKGYHLVPLMGVGVGAARVFLFRGPEPDAFHVEGALDDFTVEVHHPGAPLLREIAAPLGYHEVLFGICDDVLAEFLCEHEFRSSFSFAI